jgi:hypothetical protein
LPRYQANAAADAQQQGFGNIIQRQVWRERQQQFKEDEKLKYNIMAAGGASGYLTVNPYSEIM